MVHINLGLPKVKLCQRGLEGQYGSLPKKKKHQGGSARKGFRRPNWKGRVQGWGKEVSQKLDSSKKSLMVLAGDSRGDVDAVSRRLRG